MREEPPPQADSRGDRAAPPATATAPFTKALPFIAMLMVGGPSPVTIRIERRAGVRRCGGDGANGTVDIQATGRLSSRPCGASKRLNVAERLRVASRKTQEVPRKIQLAT